MAFRFVLLFVFCFAAGWQTARAEPAAGPADIQAQIDAAPARGLFYEIRRNGRSAFLFGTLHVGTPDFFPLERRVVDALVRSTGLAVEVDVARADALLAAMRRHALLPAGGRLDALLTPALQTRLQAQLDALGMSTRLSTLRPMGSYRLVLQGGRHGEAPTLQLSTLDGALLLSGSGQWVGQRLRFTGEARAAPEREAALANLLNIIGRRSGARSIITLG